MTASNYEQYLSEWRVNFDMSKPFYETPYYDRLHAWMQENINGESGIHWRISGFGFHVAFLSKDDALMCYLAFR